MKEEREEGLRERMKDKAKERHKDKQLRNVYTDGGERRA